jgi:hypothetical protein
LKAFFGTSFPASETFRKNYNRAVQAMYEAANPNAATSTALVSVEDVRADSEVVEDEF